MVVLNLLASQFMNGCAHCFLCIPSLSSFSLRVLRRRVHYHQYVVLMNQPSSSGVSESAQCLPRSRNISSPERTLGNEAAAAQNYIALFIGVGRNRYGLHYALEENRGKMTRERYRRTTTLMMMLLCENFFIVNQVSFIKRTELVI